jgi:preprotein translocase subunit YajC
LALNLIIETVLGSAILGTGLFSAPLLALGGSPDGGGGGGIIAQFGFLIPLFLIMYLLMIRPQQKKQKEHKNMIEALKKGDKVVTSGGMYGDIFAFNEKRDSVVLKVGEVKLEFLKSAIAGLAKE